MFEFEFGIVLFYFSFLLSFFHLKNRVCLSCVVQLIDMTWRAVMRIVTRVGDLLQRIRDGRIGQVLDSRTVERSVGVVCGLHRARGDE
jgi:hypothetical protein